MLHSGQFAQGWVATQWQSWAKTPTQWQCLPAQWPQPTRWAKRLTDNKRHGVQCDEFCCFYALP